MLQSLKITFIYNIENLTLIETFHNRILLKNMVENNQLTTMNPFLLVEMF